jgi:hypothetical protein
MHFLMSDGMVSPTLQPFNLNNQTRKPVIIEFN